MGNTQYLVAEGESAEMLQDELEYLSQMAPISIKGKITSKKISTWLKACDLVKDNPPNFPNSPIIYYVMPCFNVAVLFYGSWIL